MTLRALAVLACVVAMPLSAQARWYDAEIGMFLSEDPVDGDLANPATLHPFNYANGNPLRYTDPDGRCAWDGRGRLHCVDSTTFMEIGQTVDIVNAGTEAAFRQGDYAKGTFGVLLATVGRVAQAPFVAGLVFAIPWNASQDFAQPYGEVIASGGDWNQFDANQSLYGATQLLVLGVGGAAPAPGAATALGRLGQASATSAALNSGFNAAQQHYEIGTGARAGFSVEENLGAAATGGLVVGGMYAAAEAPAIMSEVRPYLTPSNYRMPGTMYSGLPIPEYVPPAAVQPRAYSVAFETPLDPADFGLSRGRHFQIANEALAAERAANPVLAELVSAPAGWGKAPSGWVWQHATAEQAAKLGVNRAGVLQLVPKAQHTPSSPFWRLLHPRPGGGGGYSEWAIPAGAPPN